MHFWPAEENPFRFCIVTVVIVCILGSLKISGDANPLKMSRDFAAGHGYWLRQFKTAEHSDRSS